MKKRKDHELTKVERRAVIELCADEHERAAAKFKLHGRYADAQDHETAAVGLLRLGMK